MKNWGLVIVVIMLSACASAGVEVKPSQVAALQKGVTTYSDVVNRFGPPTSTGINSNGQRTIGYVYAHAQTKAASFIPVVGIFAGGSDVRSNSVQLTFDQDDKLLEYTASESNMGVGMGGTYQTPTDQPRQSTQP